MPIDSAARICLSTLHTSSRPSTLSCVPSLRRHSRKLSQRSENEGSSSHSTRPRPPHHRDAYPRTPHRVEATDAIAHLRKTFPPLEFPSDVAQRMTTHISWNRGVDGHNGRLGFVGRRVLHTYLLLFLHECSLPPQGYTYPKNAPAPPSSRLRNSTLGTGAPIDAPAEEYDEVSERLLNTYVLGEHVGAAWQLERVMRWTPAIAELDSARLASSHALLHSSGLYKVRGATVEGVVGGIFHQFGGAVAHRVFHTRVLPYVSHLGLPTPLRARVDEACERLGGREGLLLKSSPRPGRRPDSSDGRRSPREDSDGPSESDHFEDNGTGKQSGVEFTKVDAQQRSRERQRMGYVG